MEAVLKFAALSPRGYLSDAWNVFDLIIVIGSLVDAGLAGKGVNVNFLRIFRAARLVKLLKKGDIKTLIWTFYRSLGNLPWVSALILLIFFVYGVVGMQLFARVQTHEDQPINSNSNFRTIFSVRVVLGPSLFSHHGETSVLGSVLYTFPHPKPNPSLLRLLGHITSSPQHPGLGLLQSLSLLLRAATGENWQLVMAGCHLSPPLCDPDAAEGSTCGSAAAIPYFVTFVMICMFLVVNLFVAVIVDNFDYLTLDKSMLCGCKRGPLATPLMRSPILPRFFCLCFSCPLKPVRFTRRQTGKTSPLAVTDCG